MKRAFRIAAVAAVLALTPAVVMAQETTLATDPIGELISSAVQAFTRATDLQLKATFYHAGARGVGSRDSMGCAVVPMRTLAVDPRVIPKGTIVFIQETVGLLMPDGRVHDGLWYASDTGGAIKGKRVDLFTGSGRNSMQQFFEKHLNTAVLNAVKVGVFSGCPPK